MPGQQEKTPLEETEQSLATLIQLAANPECVTSLLDGLVTCLPNLLAAAEPAENARLDRSVLTLLNRILQTVHEEWQTTCCVTARLRLVGHLTRVLRLSLDMLAGPEAVHFSALAAANRVVDLCVVHRLYHPWQFLGEDWDGTGRDDGNRVPPAQANWETGPFHAQLENLLRGSPKSGNKGSPRPRQSSWRTKGVAHHESLRSLPSVQNHEGSSRETSFMDEGESTSCERTEVSPVEVLLSTDPSRLLNILQHSLNTHKQLHGTRHKCTPSGRWRRCTYHCRLILTARLLTFMCHGSAVQHRVVTDEHIRILVEALDPNHDPHLLCLVLQALAVIAMTPAHQQALLDADLPDTLMQLLLPSDEWYYTNHSTKYARYVKYHAARILVYMGLFHRLGGRVDLFDTKMFDNNSTNPLLAMHHPEDSFIHQMALGQLVVHSADGQVLAGSLEGLIAEIIQEAENGANGSTTSLAQHQSTVLPSISVQENLANIPAELTFRSSKRNSNPECGHDVRQIEQAVAYCESVGSCSRNPRKPPVRTISGSSNTDNHHESLDSPGYLHSPMSDQVAFGDLFREYFFRSVPLVVHPIIILRVLCHKVFGSMLRRKTQLSAHNLSPPPPPNIESESCPPRVSPTGDQTQNEPQTAAAACKKRKSQLHVQIASNSPWEVAEERLRRLRRRSRRAGSIDKHLLRLGSLQKAQNGTMSLAIKAIGDSLVTPLDLNLSPPPKLSDIDIECDVKARRNIFRFSSSKKRISKSHGYLANLSSSSDDELVSGKSSVHSLHNTDDKDIREFQRELINLPMYEVDTHRMDQANSPLLSRSNSVPEHLSTAMVSQTICHISVTANEEKAEQCKRDLGKIPVDQSSSDSTENIVVHFSAATPMESPASNVDEPLSPVNMVNGSKQGNAFEFSNANSLQVDKMGVSSTTTPQLLSVNFATAPNSLAYSPFLPGSPVPVSPSISIVSQHSEFFRDISPCPTARSGSGGGMAPGMSPTHDIPSHHLAVMVVMETWVNICYLDLENSSVMKREMKDFLQKMACLGPDYRNWSVRVKEKLKLEESDTKRPSTSGCSDAENVQAQYKKLQHEVVHGDLPCSREEAATLAGIQLHLEEAWPEDYAEPCPDEELERDRLLKSEPTQSRTQRTPLSLNHRTRRFASSRRKGSRLTRRLGCVDEDGEPSCCFPSSDSKMANCLPPDFRNSRKVKELIEEKQTKLWHTPYYDHELKLKQLYIKICKNLPAYDSKFYEVKEVLQGSTSKKVRCLLCIGNERVALLDSRSKMLLHSQPLTELTEWNTGSGRGKDVLVLEFRATKPWRLMTRSVENLKAVAAALWEVMDVDGRFLDSGIQRDILDLAFGPRAASMKPEVDSPGVYTEELDQLQKLLHFPEEAAMMLTATEFQLFNCIPPMYYVRQVTVDLSRQPAQGGQPTVQNLIQRFNEVSCWVTQVIITQPTHESRKAVLSCILRLATSCWNLGNFNGAVEILAGLKCDKLKPFWLSLNDEDLSELHTLSMALLSSEPTADYRQAVAHALEIPHCPVVPFFGGFLRDIRSILAGVPSIVVLPNEGQHLESVSEFHGEDRFMTRIGVGGLINLEKLRQAHIVLQDIAVFQHHAQRCIQRLVSDTTRKQTVDYIPDDVDSDYDLDLESYQPIKSVGNSHGVTVISSRLCGIQLQDLQCMHHGTTAVHWDSNTTHSSICYLKLENENRTLSWCRPHWSSLRGSIGGGPPDYVFKANLDTPGLGARYRAGCQVWDDLEEGMIDLYLVKEVWQGISGADLQQVSRRYGLSLSSKEKHCVTLLYGNSLADNHVLEFVFPHRLAQVWFHGLFHLVQGARCQLKRHVDRRLHWLREQYLQLYHESETPQGPNPAQAIKAFGGRKWQMGPSSPSGSTESQTSTFRRNPSFVGGPVKAVKKAKETRWSIVNDSSDNRTDKTENRRKRRLTGFSKNESSDAARSVNRDEMQGKYMPLTSFSPKNLTFNFLGSRSHFRDRRKLSLGGRGADHSKPITHSTNLEFLDFIDLFKSFSMRCRKDLKDLFDQFSTATPSIEKKMPKSLLYRLPPKKESGLITRNTEWDLSSVAGPSRSKLCDAFAISSIVTNCTGLDTSGQKCLGIQEFQQFLEDYQELYPTEQELMDVIQRHEPCADMRGLCKMSFEGFARYLMDKENYAFVSERATQSTEDMSHPLSHYYVATSHNTYLTGHQLKGESSVELYAQVLLQGCRCVELDCWDGDDGSPVIYHGHTLTTKIPFKAVVEAVNRSAFVTSPYPVILSIENHCSMMQQQKMAQIFIEVLGNKLVQEFLFESDFMDDPVLPSPEQLKYRILIKNKKLRSPQTPVPVKSRLSSHARTSFSLDHTSTAYEEEDDDDDEDEDDLDVKDLPLRVQTSSSSQEGGASVSTPLEAQSSQEGGTTLNSSMLDSQETGVTVSTQLEAQDSQDSTTATVTSMASDRPSSRAQPPSVSSFSETQEQPACSHMRTKSLGELASQWGEDRHDPHTGAGTNTFSHCQRLGSVSSRDLRQRRAGSLDDLDDPTSHASQTCLMGDSRPRSGSCGSSVDDQDKSVKASWLSQLLKGRNRETSNSSEEWNHHSHSRRIKNSKEGSVDSPTSRRTSLEDHKSRTEPHEKLLRPKSVPAGEWYDDRSLEAENKKKKKVAIAKELSDIVIYTQAVKFRGLVASPSSTLRQKKSNPRRSLLSSSVGTSPAASPSLSEKNELILPVPVPVKLKRSSSESPSCCHLSSLNENKAKKISRTQPIAVIGHTERQLMRMYPAGMRIDSSNFNPVAYWMCGIQMVALNYQTDDAAMHVNTAMFEQTGHSGYVLKPSVMWDRSHPLYGRFNPWEKELEGLRPATLTIHVISGQYVCSSNLTASPVVEVELVGVPADASKLKTKIISRNALNPIWKEVFTFQVHFPELAFVRFTVMDAVSGNHLICQRVIPLRCLRPGYRHVRLRNQANQYLELSTLFVYSRLEEGLPVELTTGLCPENGHDDPLEPRRQGTTWLTKLKEGGELTQADKQLGLSPGVRHKRRLFYISVYGLTTNDEYSILKVTQDTTAAEVIHMALVKSGRQDEHPDDYVLLEDVAKSWDNRDNDKTGSQRILHLSEPVLQAQNKWRGSGKFILKKTADDPSTRAWMTTVAKEQKRRAMSSSSDVGQPDWDWSEATFLVCVYNVSPEQPYTILQAPVSSSAQDIVTQAMMKAHRPEDPHHYVLVEELVLMCGSDSLSNSKLGRAGRLERRILTDTESVYQAQQSWQSNAGKLVLKERDSISEAKKKMSARGALQRLSFMKQSILGRDKRDKHKTAPVRSEDGHLKVNHQSYSALANFEHLNLPGKLV